MCGCSDTYIIINNNNYELFFKIINQFDKKNKKNNKKNSQVKMYINQISLNLREKLFVTYDFDYNPTPSMFYMNFRWI